MHEQVMHSYIDAELRRRCHGTHLKRHSCARRVISENKKDGYGVAGVLLSNRSLAWSNQLAGCRRVLVQNSIVLVCWCLYYQSMFGTLSFMLCRVTSSKIAQRKSPGTFSEAAELQRQRNRSTRGELESTHAV